MAVTSTVSDAALVWRFAILFCATSICAARVELLGQEESGGPKWTATIHKNGEEISRVSIPVTNEISRDLDDLSKRCNKEARVDFLSYAPLIRIESDLERIDLRKKTVVYSTRKDANGSWHQRSLKSNESDKKLRQRVIEFVEANRERHES